MSDSRILSRRLSLLCACFAALMLTGCGPAARVDLVRQAGGNAALFHQYQAYDGHTGRPMTFAGVVQRCADADVIFFGEQHYDMVCNALSAQLLHALMESRRPPALAMEFFESDTQAALDAYLAGRIDEAAFMKQTRQGGKYLLSHRPMIELCRTGHVPVIAANTPRRLLQRYRASRQPFDVFRASLDPEDQRWLPTQSEHLPGPYFERFLEIMKSHPPAPTSAPASAPASSQAAESATTTSAPNAQPDLHAQIASIRPQLLWDDTMAESVANFRTVYPDRRVMLVVGRFHVASAGGTAEKFRQRRPGDRVVTLVYAGCDSANFALADEERGAGDVIICGLSPPEKPAGPMMPPATQPTSSPASAPASQPGS